MKNKYNIAVTGTGYVGLSIATLLAQHNHVTAVDIIHEKVNMINNRKSPIQDDYIEKYLATKEIDLTATLDGESTYKDADFIVIVVPDNYDSKKNYFDTSAVEVIIEHYLLGILKLEKGNMKGYIAYDLFMSIHMLFHLQGFIKIQNYL